MARATRNVTPARKGDIVNLPPGWDNAVTDDAQVEANCKDDSVSGFWVCSTHREAFQNNFQADSHEAGRGRHISYWLCAAHGAEAAI